MTPVAKTSFFLETLPVSPSAALGSTSFSKDKKSHDLFTVTMAYYLAQLHSLVMQSWDKFKETLHDTAKRKAKDHEKTSIREGLEKAIRSEGERRGLESFMKTSEGKITGRQASKFRFWQGAYNEKMHSLNLPV